jgi:hypothetical protein
MRNGLDAELGFGYLMKERVGIFHPPRQAGQTVNVPDQLTPCNIPLFRHNTFNLTTKQLEIETN